MNWLHYLLAPLIIYLHIYMMYVFLILPARWYWRRKQAGIVLIDMGKTSYQRLHLFSSLLSFGFAFFFTLNSAQHGFNARPSIVSIWLFFGGMGSHSFCLGMSRLEVRERGICVGLEVIQWQRIASYTWLGSNVLSIQLKPRIPLPLMRRRWIAVPSSYKDAVEEQLTQHNIRVKQMLNFRD